MPAHKTRTGCRKYNPVGEHINDLECRNLRSARPYFGRCRTARLRAGRSCPDTGWNWIGWIGVIPILTGVLGICPLCSALGFSTRWPRRSACRSSHDVHLYGNLAPLIGLVAGSSVVGMRGQQRVEVTAGQGLTRGPGKYELDLGGHHSDGGHNKFWRGFVIHAAPAVVFGIGVTNLIGFGGRYFAARTNTLRNITSC